MINILIKIIIGVILLILYTISVSACVDEHFTVPYNSSIQLSNNSDDIKDRHPIDSIPYDIDLKDRYKKAYYYELNNDDYLAFLKAYFSTCMDGLKDFTNIIDSTDVEWTTDLTDIASVKGFYDQGYQYLSNRFDKKDIKIVHDVLNRYKKLDNNKVLFDIDLILYRHGKINGKHVNMVLLKDFTKTIVIDVSIKGIVGEDKIYMHPVELYQKQGMAYADVDTDETN